MKMGNSDTVQKVEAPTLKVALFNLHLLRQQLPNKRIEVTLFPIAIEIRDEEISDKNKQGSGLP